MKYTFNSLPWLDPCITEGEILSSDLFGVVTACWSNNLCNREWHDCLHSLHMKLFTQFARALMKYTLDNPLQLDPGFRVGWGGTFSWFSIYIIQKSKKRTYFTIH